MVGEYSPGLNNIQQSLFTPSQCAVFPARAQESVWLSLKPWNPVSVFWQLLCSMFTLRTIRTIAMRGKSAGIARV